MAMFGECMHGISTVRTFKRQDLIYRKFQAQINQVRSCRIIIFGLYKWLFIRFQLCQLLVIIPTFVTVIYASPDVGMIALLITNIFGISDNIQDLLQEFTAMENNFVSWERCTNYLNLEPEVGYTDIAATHQRFKKKLPLVDEKYNKAMAEGSWPTEGAIEFKDFSVRYRPDLEPAIKCLNLKIEPGKKVGIVGRTGAGKTTFMWTIFKSFETYDGQLLIDGQEISSMDLKRLRMNITVIPQDPHLFDDTLRINLDPLGNFKDADMIVVLQKLGIWEKFDTFKGTEDQRGLNYKIENNAENLAKGEKQLLCMARALLNRNKIILLDEATANIDYITENLIQKALQEYFQDSTILMIAHRLNTIMWCDNILVLEKGEKLEYGDLKDLQKDPNSKFGKLVKLDNDLKEYMK